MQDAASACALLEGAVDALTLVGGLGQVDVLVAGTSTFIGPVWGGSLAVLRCSSADAAQSAPTLTVTGAARANAGVPALAALPSDDATSGRVLVAGYDDGSLEQWALSGVDGDAPQLQYLQGKIAHDRAVTCVAPALSGSMLASGGGDGAIRLWDCAGWMSQSGGLGGEGWEPAPPVAGLAWAASSGGGGGAETLASAAQDGTCTLWDTRSCRAGATCRNPHALTCVSWVDDNLLAAGDLLGRVLLLDPRSLASPLAALPAHTDAVRQLTVQQPGRGGGSGASGSASGAVLLSCGDDGAVCSIDASAAPSAVKLGDAACGGQYVRALAVNAARGLAYCGGWDGSVRAVPLVDRMDA